jgi:hypothetical protein
MSKVIVETKRPKHQRKGENTNEYYNIRVIKPYNPALVQQNIPEPITFNTTRTSPVLQNPSDYELAVVRFYLPSEVPIFIFDNDPDGIGQFLQVGFEFDGATFISNLVYDPYCPQCIPEGSVLFYQEFLDMINTAFEDAYAGITALKPAFPPATAPYMTYNATNQLCSLLAETAYATPTIKIYMNIVMYNRFFPSLPIRGIENYLTQTYASLRVQDNKNNTNATIPSIPVGYYQMLQEYSTLALWNDLQTILLETNSIPVEPEYEPSETDITRRLLTDFEPVVGINDRQAFQYQPQGALRWYDLKSNYPLKTLDLQVYWQSKTGKVYPLPLLQGESATLKLRFRHKGTQDYYDEDYSF